MLSHRIYLILAMGLATLFSGCFSFETATLTGEGEETIFVSNYGWYLFNWLPLATGNATEEALSPIVLFRNDAQMDKVQSRALKYAEKKNKSLKDLSYHNYESVMLNIPGLDFPLPIPYVLTFREIQLSGVLK